MSMIFVYVTFPNKKEAAKIGFELVRRKLASCVNIFPIESIYWSHTFPHGNGQDKIVKDKEVAMIIKTIKQNFRKVENFILKHHSYTIPCIIEIPVGRVTKKYLKWLFDSTKL